MNLRPHRNAARFGVSIKALRLYEQRGCWTPLRSQAAAHLWSGPDRPAAPDTRPQRLAAPGENRRASGRPDALETVLALQERSWRRDSEQLSRAWRWSAPRGQVEASQTLSIDDLANLTKETVMTTPVIPWKWGALLKPFAERHLTESDRAAMKAKVPDRDQAIRSWDACSRKPMP